MASWANWLNVRLRTKGFWVQISLLSLKLQIWCLLRARSSVTFRETIECGFTLELVRNMIITFSQLLNTLWSYAVPETFKRSSICQCIIKASGPRTALSPLLICFGIECDHVFGSEWLGNELFKLGFSISHSEVFKKSIVANQPMRNSAISSCSNAFTQFEGVRDISWNGDYSDINSLSTNLCFKRM